MMKTLDLFKAALLMSFASFFLACEEDDVTTAKSPVQAVTTLLEKSDGTVEAELVLISTTDADDHMYVSEAANVVVRVPTLEPTEVPLNLSSAGKYTADSTDNLFLEYVAGETYQFKFNLDSEVAGDVSGGNFVAVMDAPTEEVTFTYSELPEFDGDSSVITWTPTNLQGIYTIRDSSDNVVHKNFDFDNPTFSGDKWARLAWLGSHTLGTDIYQAPGDYSIEFCAVSYTSGYNNSLSAELGALSGFLIGRCAEPFHFTVVD